MFDKINMEGADRGKYCPALFEIVPPTRENEKKRLARHIDLLKTLFEETEVDALNLPDIQDESTKSKKGKRRSPFKERISPRAYSRTLSKHFDTRYVINHVVVNRTAEEEEEWLLETYNDYDIQEVILVGGESSEEDYDGPSVPESNELVSKYLNKGKRRYGSGKIDPVSLSVGNICIPTRRRDDFDEQDRMFKKFQAGASFFTSQIIAESESPISLIKDFSELCEEYEVENPPAIIWSFAPISTQKDVDFLRWLGVYIPEKTEKLILGSDNPAATSIDIVQNVWEKMIDFNKRLSVPIPMGFNTSVMGVRNFDNGIRLTKDLKMVAVAD